MEITYIGHSCFKIKGKFTTVITDPYDPSALGYKLPKLSGDIVLVSHQHEDHNYTSGVSDYKMVIDTPGEYEVSGVFVSAHQTYHDAKNGTERGKNTIYQIEIDGFNILHLGDLGHELSKETLEKLPTIDVLFIPVGGSYTMDAKVAAKVTHDIEPAFTIPMHYQTEDLTKLPQKLDGVEKFLGEMGYEDKDTTKMDSLKLSSRSDVPEETDLVILLPQH
ncbi:MBL fold metallo-hydrolase [Patescibacteria group bacterium]|nr:MBL fold metallo-hydrolase [Patescibacteria group bacterium]